MNDSAYSFGPVPSRRLGKSIGINNIPAKTCTYACVYCQVGRTSRMRIGRLDLYDPDDIYRDLSGRIENALSNNESIDYLTIVPDGEPTLDARLGNLMEKISTLGFPIGIITNGSLLWRKSVRDDLAAADWVSVKVDSVNEDEWRAVDRPHGALSLDTIKQGILDFADGFEGRLVTETMTVAGINEDYKGLAEFLELVRPEVAYLSRPIRPPVEDWVRAPSEEFGNELYQELSIHLPRVEFLSQAEADDFAYTGDVERDILNTIAVHPMRFEAARKLLQRAGCDWGLVQELIHRGSLKSVEYRGESFLVLACRQNHNS